MAFSVGVDTGGTFTDISVMDQSGEVTVHKALTTQPNPLPGVLEGLGIAAAERGLSVEELLGQTDFFVYGTTFATNVIVQRGREGKAGLLITRGFGDTLPIRRMMRRSTFDIQEVYPVPLVSRRLTREVHERTDYAGAVRIPVDLKSALTDVRWLVEQGCDAVAICLLHSYMNAQNESALRDAILAEWPDLYVTTSQEVAPEIREYERASTTVMNAYVGPAVALHLNHLQAGLQERRLRTAPLIMQSNGGVMGVEEGARKPVNMLASGPAGGMTASAYLAGLTGTENIITMDMGGTSFDVGLVIGGEVAAVTHGEIDGWPLLGRRFDVHSIGAGGGSIASVDVNGLIKVGPRSAGSNPGPACYGRGGEFPTVTDADVVLGYVDPDYFVGGRIRLDRDRAMRALQEHICSRNGMSEAEAAGAIYQVVNAKMVDAIRLMTVKRGRDPREFTALGFGGAGPVHAAAIHSDLGTQQLVVPALATGLSSFGMLVADLRHSFAQTVKMRLDSFDLDRANQVLAQMEGEALALLHSEGVPDSAIQIRVALDMCYQGQLHELTVSIPQRRLRGEDLAGVAAAFTNLYQQRYGFHEEFAHVQVVTLRLDGIGLVPHPTIRAHPPGSGSQAAVKGRRRAFFASAGRYVEAEIYAGHLLRPGAELSGPAIVEYPGTNFVVLPGQAAVCDPWLNLVVR